MARTINTLRNTPLCVRLVRKLKTLKDFPQMLHESRYALMGYSHGHHQKNAGAWSWDLWVLNDNNEWKPAHVGGSEPASRMVRNDVRLSWYEIGWGNGIEVVAEN